MSENKPNSLGLGFYIDLTIASISSGIAKTFIAPLEKIKITLQTQDANTKIMSKEIPRYTGIYNCFSRHIRELGAKSLWRGNLTNYLKFFPVTYCNLFLKDPIKNMFSQQALFNQQTPQNQQDFTNPDLNLMTETILNFVSGATTGLVTQAAVYPLI